MISGESRQVLLEAIETGNPEEIITATARALVSDGEAMSELAERSLEILEERS